MSNNNPITEFIDNLIVEIKQFVKDSLVNLAVLMAIVTFIVNITATPTTSMYPTVKKGDVFLLLKFPYGFNLRSFDVGPIGISHNYFWKNIFTYIPQKKLLGFGGVRPGDVISFKIDGDLDTGFLKRTIAVENQTIQMVQGHLHIDGRPVPRRFIRSKEVLSNENKGSKKKITYLYYEETLSNKYKYIARYIKGNEYDPMNNTPKFFIPEGFVFAMGDNRDKSDDSRGNIGLVPTENLSGKGFVIIFSKSSKLTLFTLDLKVLFTSLIKLPTHIKWKRIFTWL